MNALECSSEWDNARITWLSTLCRRTPVTSESKISYHGNIAAVASGCSLSVARIIERFANQSGSCMARAFTPLEFTRSDTRPDLTFLVTAEGNHTDIVRAGELAFARSQTTCVLTTNADCEIAQLAQRSNSRTQVWASTPCRTRGSFLPIEATIGMLAVLVRHWFRLRQPEAEAIFDSALRQHEMISRTHLEGRIDVVHVIGCSWSLPAAHDLESRCTESGIGKVYVSDLWHIGHGRYMSLHPQLSGQLIILLATHGERDDLQLVHKLLPSPMARITLIAPFAGALGAVHNLILAMRLASSLIHRAQLNQQTSGLPSWGYRLYSERAEGSKR